ncbi:Sulfite efflux pump SSU1 [Spathaspora sp. JA1]|nr:Sulfite efflux pump SSU1 [Spathaspora sp. JA1]
MSTSESVYSASINSSSCKTSRKIVEFLKYELVDQFHPSYFVGFLGCGITGNLLYEFPYPAKWLQICGIIMFCITILLFFLTTTFVVLSCLFHHDRIRVYHYDSNFSIYMGVYSMGFTTIVNGVHYLLDGKYPYLPWVLWWISVSFSVYNASFIFYFSFLSKLTKHNLKDINATIFIPIVCPCVVSSSGNLIAMTLTNLNHRIITSIASLLLLCVSLVLFHGLGALYMARLVLYKIPDTSQVFTTFLPIGFLGQSSYSIMLFGINMYDLIPDKNLGNSLLFPCGLFASSLLAGGYIFTFLAIISTLSKIKPFAKNLNMEYTKHGLIKWSKSYWTMTFPLGTMALANIEISRSISMIPGGYELKFFKVVSCMFSVAVVFVCLANIIGMIEHIWELVKGNFFSTIVTEEGQHKEVTVIDKV